MELAVRWTDLQAGRTRTAKYYVQRGHSNEIILAKWNKSVVDLDVSFITKCLSSDSIETRNNPSRYREFYGKGEVESLTHHDAVLLVIFKDSWVVGLATPDQSRTSLQNGDSVKTWPAVGHVSTRWRQQFLPDRLVSGCIASVSNLYDDSNNRLPYYVTWNETYLYIC